MRNLFCLGRVGSVFWVALVLAACGGGEAVELGTTESTVVPATQTTSTTEPTTTTLITTTTAPSTTTTTVAALVPTEVLNDEAGQSRRSQLVEDLMSLDAPGRWVETHSVDGDDQYAWIDLTGQMAEAQGVSLDLEGERNVLANLAAFSPLAICQWAEEGVPLDDIRGAITDAVSPHTADRSSAAFFPGWSGSIAKGIVCPEYEDAMTLQYVGTDEPIITDGFDLEESGWPVASYDWGQVQYSSGFYRMLPDGSGTLLESVLPDTRTNVAISVFVRPIRGADSQTGYGVMCRQDSTSGYLNGYLFQVTTDGGYNVVRYSENQFEVLKEGRSDLIHPGDSWNHLIAICQGPRLALLVNGSFVAQVDDDTYTVGKVGLAAWSMDQTGVDIVIEDFFLSIPNDEVLAMLDSVSQGN